MYGVDLSYSKGIIAGAGWSPALFFRCLKLVLVHIGALVTSRTEVQTDTDVRSCASTDDALCSSVSNQLGFIRTITITHISDIIVNNDLSIYRMNLDMTATNCYNNSILYSHMLLMKSPMSRLQRSNAIILNSSLNYNSSLHNLTA